MDIIFHANDPSNPLTPLAADFWHGKVSVVRNSYFQVIYTHSQKALGLKYGMKPPALQRTQRSLGHPALPSPLCCDCGRETMMTLRWSACGSRAAFEQDVRAWTTALCESCVVRKAEKEKQAKADRMAAEIADRERLRKKYGAQYLKDCPACSGVLYLRKGRNVGSMFVACSSWPACSHKEPMLPRLPAPALAEIERVKAEIAAAVPCPKCGAGKLRTVNGAHGPFLGCTKYPTCRFTQNIPAPPVNPTSDELVGRFE
jgi:ssDNA-binding Zn-finger/Zn-ribbon topoisomerase 1